MVTGNVPLPTRRGKLSGQAQVGSRFRRMMHTFRLAIVFVAVTVVGCANDPNATADIEGDRAPLTSPGANTMNSPTTGQTSAGLSGGTAESAPPEINTRPTRTY